LLAAGANVTMVTPGITPQLKRLVKLKRLKWRKDKVSKKEILGARLVIAATNNPAVNRKVSSWARERKILANVVDRPALSDFISPAVLRKDKAIIAVYTDGKDPVLSRDLKNFLKENWSEFISYRRRL